MSQAVRILLVEDEFITLDALRDNLEEIGYAISGDAMSADEAIAILDRGDTDIAILDIQLKGVLSGIWLAERIRDQYHIPFIFLTAYSDQATIRAAAATEPSAYLVKPFSPADLYASIELALLTYARRTTGAAPTEATADAPGELAINDSIYLKEDQVYTKIFPRDILYIEAFKNYLEIHLADQRHVIRSTLRDFLTVLPRKYFLQTHRSFVVNQEKIERLDGQFLRVGKKDIPISRTYREEVLARLRFYG